MSHSASFCSAPLPTCTTLRWTYELVLERHGKRGVPLVRGDVDYLAASGQGRKLEFQLSVEPSWAPQRRVDRVGAVGGTNHDDLHGHAFGQPLTHWRRRLASYRKEGE